LEEEEEEEEEEGGGYTFYTSFHKKQFLCPFYASSGLVVR
jgi:hypothetical protein